MSKRLVFLLNGQQYFTEYDLTILELINYFNYSNSLFVLEYNNLICNKKNWDKVIIKNNDKIIILIFLIQII